MKELLDKPLSRHFMLREFVRSATAERLRIDNLPSWKHVSRMCNLCIRVLEPIRCRFGVIILTSGYRSPELNRAVGGVENSQHTKGEAADIRVCDLETGRKMLHFIARHCDFDQAILERSRRTGALWLHVSSRIATTDNRRQAFVSSSVARREKP